MTLTLVPEPIEEYAAEHTEAPAAIFEKLRHETYSKMSLPQMQVGRIEGTFLKLLVRLSRAKRVLEIGMFTGYSGLMMAEGLPDDGELITCDVDPKAEAMAKRYFAQSPLGKKIHIRMGPALETMARVWFPQGRQAVDLRGTLRALSMPVQVIWGRDDRIIPVAHGEATVPPARLHVLDGVGHLPHMEKSGEVNRLIRAVVA